MSYLDTSSLSPSALLDFSSTLITTTAYVINKHDIVGAMVEGVTTASILAKEMLPNLKIESVELPDLSLQLIVFTTSTLIALEVNHGDLALPITAVGGGILGAIDLWASLKTTIYK